jgi:CRISPR-associated protein Cas1
MGWRFVMVQQAAELSVRRRQLVIQTGAECSSVPLEDLNTLLLESRQSHITTAALSVLAEEGVALLVCDETHLPCGILMPYAQHSRHLTVVETQLKASQPRKNRLWQQIVRMKIKNQSLCLRLQGLGDSADSLDAYAKNVLSGDSGNMEAAAASLYFRALFGRGFRRGQDNGVNAALNYGYAILRGLIARTLALYGFLSCLGLHHGNDLNAFNLTDDMMEPFRPLVDLYAAEHTSTDMVLTTHEKLDLLALMTMEVRMEGQRYSVFTAADRMVQSLSRAMQVPGQPGLALPELLPLARHRNE